MRSVKKTIAQVLLSQLKLYIENVDIEHLGLLGGDIVLENLRLRKDVLRESLKIPTTFDISRGIIKHLRISIPWSRMHADPILQIKIRTIEIVIIPVTKGNGEYDDQDRKCRDGNDNINDGSLKKKSLDDDIDESSGGNSWVQNMLKKMMLNASVQIEHLVVKYEDDDIVLSAALRSLEIYSADPFDNWKERFCQCDGIEALLYKVVEIRDWTLCLDQYSTSIKDNLESTVRYVDHYELPLLDRTSLKIRMRISVQDIFKVDTSNGSENNKEINQQVSDPNAGFLLNAYDSMFLYFGSDYDNNNNNHNHNNDNNNNNNDDDDDDDGHRSNNPYEEEATTVQKFLANLPILSRFSKGYKRIPKVNVDPIQDPASSWTLDDSETNDKTDNNNYYVKKLLSTIIEVDIEKISITISERQINFLEKLQSLYNKREFKKNKYEASMNAYFRQNRKEEAFDDVNNSDNSNTESENYQSEKFNNDQNNDEHAHRNIHVSSVFIKYFSITFLISVPTQEKPRRFFDFDRQSKGEESIMMIPVFGKGQVNIASTPGASRTTPQINKRTENSIPFLLIEVEEINVDRQNILLPSSNLSDIQLEVGYLCIKHVKNSNKKQKFQQEQPSTNSLVIFQLGLSKGNKAFVDQQKGMKHLALQIFELEINDKHGDDNTEESKDTKYRDDTLPCFEEGCAFQARLMTHKSSFEKKRALIKKPYTHLDLRLGFIDILVTKDCFLDLVKFSNSVTKLRSTRQFSDVASSRSSISLDRIDSSVDHSAITHTTTATISTESPLMPHHILSFQIRSQGFLVSSSQFSENKTNIIYVESPYLKISHNSELKSYALMQFSKLLIAVMDEMQFLKMKKIKNKEDDNCTTTMEDHSIVCLKKISLKLSTELNSTSKNHKLNGSRKYEGKQYGFIASGVALHNRLIKLELGIMKYATFRLDIFKLRELKKFSSHMQKIWFNLDLDEDFSKNYNDDDKMFDITSHFVFSIDRVFLSSTALFGISSHKCNMKLEIDRVNLYSISVKNNCKSGNIFTSRQAPFINLDISLVDFNTDLIEQTSLYMALNKIDMVLVEKMSKNKKIDTLPHIEIKAMLNAPDIYYKEFLKLHSILALIKNTIFNQENNKPKKKRTLRTGEELPTKIQENYIKCKIKEWTILIEIESSKFDIYISNLILTKVPCIQLILKDTETISVQCEAELSLGGCSILAINMDKNKAPFTSYNPIIEIPMLNMRVTIKNEKQDLLSLYISIDVQNIYTFFCEENIALLAMTANSLNKRSSSTVSEDILHEKSTNIFAYKEFTCNLKSLATSVVISDPGINLRRKREISFDFHNIHMSNSVDISSSRSIGNYKLGKMSVYLKTGRLVDAFNSLLSIKNIRSTVAEFLGHNHSTSFNLLYTLLKRQHTDTIKKVAIFLCKDQVEPFINFDTESVFTEFIKIKLNIGSFDLLYSGEIINKISSLSNGLLFSPKMAGRAELEITKQVEGDKEPLTIEADNKKRNIPDLYFGMACCNLVFIDGLVEECKNCLVVSQEQFRVEVADSNFTGTQPDKNISSSKKFSINAGAIELSMGSWLMEALQDESCIISKMISPVSSSTFMMGSVEYHLETTHVDISITISPLELKLDASQFLILNKTYDEMKLGATKSKTKDTNSFSQKKTDKFNIHFAMPSIRCLLMRVSPKGEERASNLLIIDLRHIVMTNNLAGNSTKVKNVCLYGSFGLSNNLEFFLGKNLSSSIDDDAISINTCVDEFGITLNEITLGSCFFHYNEKYYRELSKILFPTTKDLSESTMNSSNTYSPKSRTEVIIKNSIVMISIDQCSPCLIMKQRKIKVLQNFPSDVNFEVNLSGWNVYGIEYLCYPLKDLNVLNQTIRKREPMVLDCAITITQKRLYSYPGHPYITVTHIEGDIINFNLKFLHYKILNMIFDHFQALNLERKQMNAELRAETLKNTISDFSKAFIHSTRLTDFTVVSNKTLNPDQMMLLSSSISIIKFNESTTDDYCDINNKYEKDFVLLTWCMKIPCRLKSIETKTIMEIEVDERSLNIASKDYEFTIFVLDKASNKVIAVGSFNIFLQPKSNKSTANVIMSYKCDSTYYGTNWFLCLHGVDEDLIENFGIQIATDLKNFTSFSYFSFFGDFEESIYSCNFRSLNFELFSDKSLHSNDISHAPLVIVKCRNMNAKTILYQVDELGFSKMCIHMQSDPLIEVNMLYNLLKHCFLNCSIDFMYKIGDTLIKFNHSNDDELIANCKSVLTNSYDIFTKYMQMDISLLALQTIDLVMIDLARPLPKILFKTENISTVDSDFEIENNYKCDDSKDNDIFGRYMLENLTRHGVWFGQYATDEVKYIEPNCKIAYNWRTLPRSFDYEYVDNHVSGPIFLSLRFALHCKNGSGRGEASVWSSPVMVDAEGTHCRKLRLRDETKTEEDIVKKNKFKKKQYSKSETSLWVCVENSLGRTKISIRGGHTFNNFLPFPLECRFRFTNEEIESNDIGISQTNSVASIMDSPRIASNSFDSSYSSIFGASSIFSDSSLTNTKDDSDLSSTEILLERFQGDYSTRIEEDESNMNREYIFEDDFRKNNSHECESIFILENTLKKGKTNECFCLEARIKNDNSSYTWSNSVTVKSPAKSFERITQDMIIDNSNNYFNDTLTEDNNSMGTSLSLMRCDFADHPSGKSLWFWCKIRRVPVKIPLAIKEAEKSIYPEINDLMLGWLSIEFWPLVCISCEDFQVSMKIFSSFQYNFDGGNDSDDELDQTKRLLKQKMMQISVQNTDEDHLFEELLIKPNKPLPVLTFQPFMDFSIKLSSSNREGIFQDLHQNLFLTQKVLRGQDDCLDAVSIAVTSSMESQSFQNIISYCYRDPLRMGPCLVIKIIPGMIVRNQCPFQLSIASVCRSDEIFLKRPVASNIDLSLSNNSDDGGNSHTRSMERYDIVNMITIDSNDNRTSFFQKSLVSPDQKPASNSLYLSIGGLFEAIIIQEKHGNYENEDSFKNYCWSDYLDLFSSDDDDDDDDDDDNNNVIMIKFLNEKVLPLNVKVKKRFIDGKANFKMYDISIQPRVVFQNKIDNFNLYIRTWHEENFQTLSCSSAIEENNNSIGNENNVYTPLLEPILGSHLLKKRVGKLGFDQDKPYFYFAENDSEALDVDNSKSSHRFSSDKLKSSLRKLNDDDIFSGSMKLFLLPVDESQDDSEDRGISFYKGTKQIETNMITFWADEDIETFSVSNCTKALTLITNDNTKSDTFNSILIEFHVRFYQGTHYVNMQVVPCPAIVILNRSNQDLFVLSMANTEYCNCGLDASFLPNNSEIEMDFENFAVTSYMNGFEKISFCSHCGKKGNRYFTSFEDDARKMEEKIIKLHKADVHKLQLGCHGMEGETTIWSNTFLTDRPQIIALCNNFEVLVYTNYIGGMLHMVIEDNSKSKTYNSNYLKNGEWVRRYAIFLKAQQFNFRVVDDEALYIRGDPPKHQVDHNSSVPLHLVFPCLLYGKCSNMSYCKYIDEFQNVYTKKKGYDQIKQTAPHEVEKIIERSMVIESMQINNLLKGCEFPLVLKFVTPRVSSSRNNKDDHQKSKKSKKGIHHKLELKMVSAQTFIGYRGKIRQITLHKEVMIYLPECQVAIDDCLVHIFHRIVSDLSFMKSTSQLSSSSSFSNNNNNNNNNNQETSNISRIQKREDQERKKILDQELKQTSLEFFEQINVSPISMNLTLRVTLPNSQIFLGMERSSLFFNKVEMHSIMCSQSILFQEITAKYVADTFMSPSLMGSLQILGSPSVIWSHISQGLHDLFAFPINGIKTGQPVTAVKSAGKGMKSFVRHLAGAGLESISGFSLSVSRNLQRYETSSGVFGFFMATVTRPVTGVMDFVWRTSDSLVHSTQTNEYIFAQEDNIPIKMIFMDITLNTDLWYRLGGNVIFHDMEHFKAEYNVSYYPYYYDASSSNNNKGSISNSSSSSSSTKYENIRLVISTSGRITLFKGSYEMERLIRQIQVDTIFTITKTKIVIDDDNNNNDNSDNNTNTNANANAKKNHNDNESKQSISEKQVKFGLEFHLINEKKQDIDHIKNDNTISSFRNSNFNNSNNHNINDDSNIQHFKLEFKDNREIDSFMLFIQSWLSLPQPCEF